MTSHDSTRTRRPARHGSLGGDGCCGGRDGLAECREEGIALGLDDDAAMLLDGGSEEVIVAGNEDRPRGRSDGALKPGRSLDVRE